MIIKAAWLLPALALPMLSACAGKTPPPRPIPALAEQRQCPAYPLPPAALLRPRRTSTFSIRRFDRDRAGDPARRADQMGAAAERGRSERSGASAPALTRQLQRGLGSPTFSARN